MLENSTPLYVWLQAGAFLYFCGDAQRKNIPAVAVVFDNGLWDPEKRHPTDYFDSRFLGTELEKAVVFAEVARARGVRSLTVEHEHPIGDAFKPRRSLLAKGAAFSAEA